MSNSRNLADLLDANGDVSLGDNVKAKFGASDDLQIYHDGVSRIKELGAGGLYVDVTNDMYIRRGDTSAVMAEFNAGVAKLMFDGSQKLATTSTGIDVTGSVTCDGLTSSSNLSVSGSNGAGVTLSDGGTENGGEIQLLNTNNAVKGLIDIVDGDDDGEGAMRFLNLSTGPSSVVEIGCTDTNGRVLVKAGGAERMRITSSGNVGIGTSSPSVELHITSSTPDIRLQDSDGTNQYTEMTQSNGSAFISSRNNTLDGNIIFRGLGGGSATEYMRITSAGNVGIGTSSPSEKLYVSGNIYATGNVTAYSDERIKKNINEIPNALDAIDAIRGVSYTRTDTEEDSIGVIAQEVEALFPELIAENNEGMKSVNYNGLIGVLFSAVKELSAKVKALEAK